MTPKFRDYALTTLDLRQAAGIRGIKSERNRFSVHIAMADFAKLPLGEIRPAHIREWVRVMQGKKAADTRGSRLLSDETVKRSLALVSSISTHAVESDIIETSFTRDVKVKKRANADATVEKWAFLTIEEQKRIAACEDIDIADRFAIRFAVGTGLRQGEQFNLELRDLHTGVDEPHVFVRYGSRGTDGRSKRSSRSWGIRR